MKGKQTALCKI